MRVDSLGARHTQRQGTVFGLMAYLLWGAMPLYFHSLAPIGPWEILAHRILWSLVLCSGLLLAARRLRVLGPLLRDRRTFLGILAASLLIAANWVIYVLAVLSGHVTEASFGYFLNPLVTVALGVLVLHERLRAGQWLAVGVGAIACAFLAFAYGQVPWIALALALSFAFYGLVKKRVSGRMDPLVGLTSETLVLAPVALAVVVLLGFRGEATFGAEGVGHSLLLLAAGPITTIPLWLFGAAAARVPLVTIGLLQFITPVLQFLTGVYLLGETMTPARWVGFAVIWVALVILSLDAVRAARRNRRLG